MKKLLASFIALVSVTIACVSLQAQNAEGRKGPGGPGGRMDPAARLKQMEEALSLTADQKAKIEAIFAEQRKEMEAIPQDQRREKMREIMVKYRDKMAAILTPEQKAKFEQMRPQGGRGGPDGKGPGKKQ